MAQHLMAQQIVYFCAFVYVHMCAYKPTCN